MLRKQMDAKFFSTCYTQSFMSRKLKIYNALAGLLTCPHFERPSHNTGVLQWQKIVKMLH